MNWLRNLFKPNPTTKQLLRLNAENRRLREEIKVLKAEAENRIEVLREIHTAVKNASKGFWWY